MDIDMTRRSWGLRRRPRLLSVVVPLLALCLCGWFVLLSCACACGLLISRPPLAMGCSSFRLFLLLDSMDIYMASLIPLLTWSVSSFWVSSPTNRAPNQSLPQPRVRCLCLVSSLGVSCDFIYLRGWFFVWSFVVLFLSCRALCGVLRVVCVCGWPVSLLTLLTWSGSSFWVSSPISRAPNATTSPAALVIGITNRPPKRSAKAPSLRRTCLKTRYWWHSYSNCS